MRLKFATKSILVLVAIASILSFAKFDHCYKTNWASPDVYVHSCYSDLPALYGARDLIHKTWPYSSPQNAVEYPPVTGLIMWAASLATPQGINSYRYYFLINALLIVIVFAGSAIILSRIKPEFWYLLPLSPALILSLYINWDMWAVISALASIYWFDNRSYTKSAVSLGLSIATKFFPIVLLAPIVLIFIRRQQITRAIRFVSISLGVWGVINLPFIIFHQAGWLRFFKLNSERNADFGSLWYALQLFGIHIRNLNTISILTFLIGIAAFTVYFFGVDKTPSLAGVAFTAVAIFTLANKVYSPQYVLWLTPLAILALRDLRDRKYFWIWQGAEVVYHFAVWQYLAEYSGSRFGLSPRAYALATLIRVAVTVLFAVAVSTRSKAPQLGEFLSSSIAG
jgi:hypothetical protein